MGKVDIVSKNMSPSLFCACVCVCVCVNRFVYLVCVERTAQFNNHHITFATAFNNCVTDIHDDVQLNVLRCWADIFIRDKVSKTKVIACIFSLLF